ncbi:hypothetical protein Plhal304r1_c028g0092891 [Plasmopara halstedii]
MNLTQPTVNASPPQSVDTRPKMADFLRQQEISRRYNADVEVVRRRVRTPKPLTCDIEAIDRQYVGGDNWSFISTRMEQARLYVLSPAKYDMMIDTGRTFAMTPLQINHGVAGWQAPWKRSLHIDFAIEQVLKLPVAICARK